MPKTVLITGCSSGIGRATALYFADRGWNVIATVRDMEGKCADLKGHKVIDLVRLDVTDIGSIESAVKLARDKYKTVDVVVNNAGYSVSGVFEASTSEQARKQFGTNVLGLMDVTREVIPIMRAQGSGVIINVSSIGGRVASPLYSLYQSTKFAVEGFSESLFYELRSQNIKVKLVEPGTIKTDFYGRSMDKVNLNVPDSYRRFVESASRTGEKIIEKGSTPDVVAKCIYDAANDGSWRLRYHTGKYSTLLLTMRKILPDHLMMRLVHGSKGDR
jgi:short-subunit dehydrogenase